VRPHYFAVAAVTVLVAAAGSAFARSGMPWYRRLSLPSWTPPPPLIGLLWTLIYLLAAVSAILALDAAGPSRSPMIAALYAVNAFLNLAWPYLFFTRRQIGSATLDAALLTVSVAVLGVQAFPLSPAAAVLLAPYLLWSAFATFLSYVIFRRNPTAA
jgi:benzodiazapine receptor